MSKEYGMKGAFVNLTPYIEEGKMKNFTEMLKKHGPSEALSKSLDGNIYGVPRIYDGVYMDQTWQVPQGYSQKAQYPSFYRYGRGVGYACKTKGAVS